MRIIAPLRSVGQTLTAIADTMNDMGARLHGEASGPRLR